jgi:hypothetical protein
MKNLCSECKNRIASGVRNTFGQPAHKGNNDIEPSAYSESNFICSLKNINLFNVQPKICNNFNQLLTLNANQNE